MLGLKRTSAQKTTTIKTKHHNKNNNNNKNNTNNKILPTPQNLQNIISPKPHLQMMETKILRRKGGWGGRSYQIQ